jgi:hypothetical protein
MLLEIEFSDGRVAARADGAVSSDKSETDPGKPRPRRGSGPGQGSLF